MRRAFAKKNDDDGSDDGRGKKTDLEIFEEQKRLKEGKRKTTAEASAEETQT